MKRIIEDYLEDILEECNYLLERSKNFTYEAFIENEDLKRAFIRSLENYWRSHQENSTRNKNQIS